MSGRLRGRATGGRHQNPRRLRAKHNRDSQPRPVHAFRVWPEIAERMKASDPRVVLLDFDGTLAPLRKDPTAAKLSQRAKRLLHRLATTKGVTVAIVSGRNARTVRDLVGLDQIGYFGLHGSENIKALRISGWRSARRFRAPRDGHAEGCATLRGWALKTKDLVSRSIIVARATQP